MIDSVAYKHHRAEHTNAAGLSGFGRLFLDGFAADLDTQVWGNKEQSEPTEGSVGSVGG